MAQELLKLEPQDVWRCFYQLTQVPRPSKHEDKIQKFMLDFGKLHGLESFRDEVGNIIIRKSASTGYEDRAGVVLQAHLDMVPQANNDTPHDFINQPINAYIDGDWVKAKGTTLGADNGIGVAAMMAVLADDNIAHGPIEALFTCDEETSMKGAFGLKKDILKGDILINLDYEDEKELCIGCAGGIDIKFSLPIKRQPLSVGKSLYKLTIKGLKGGHSGIDIILQRGNANKLLARWLTLLDFDWQLLSFDGGNMINAIPREAYAVIAITNDNKIKLESTLVDFTKIITREYGKLEPNFYLNIDCNPKLVTNKKNVLTKASQETLINTINACHNGVYRMSIDMDNLVETSNNLAIITSNDEQIEFACMLRSSVGSACDDMVSKLSAVFALAGASVRYDGKYPGWQPNTKSNILSVMKTTGKKIFGKTPNVSAIHAGLECGLFVDTYPHWDMISFGPDIRYPHSPDEKVNIASVNDFYQWLLVTLQAIPKK